MWTNAFNEAGCSHIDAISSPRISGLVGDVSPSVSCGTHFAACLATKDGLIVFGDIKWPNNNNVIDTRAVKNGHWVVGSCGVVLSDGCNAMVCS